MTCSNSVNLEQLDGGTVIKQGDVSSRFEYRLLDENNEVIPLAGREAKISIGKSGYLYFETRTTVSETNTVSFTITSVLPVGTHRVEVACAGYVFPSDKSTTITVKKSHEEYAVAGALDKVHYDDTELREGLSEVSSKVAEQAEALSDVKATYGSRLEALEAKPDFDDSALKAKDLEQDGRLQVLEGQTDETTQGLTAIQRTVSDFKGTQETVQSAFNSRLQRLEEKPDFDDSKLKAKDVEQDGRLSGLEDKARTLELASSTQNETLTELDSRLSANTQRLQVLETKPDFDPSPLKAKDSEQDERLSALEGETAQISELQSSVSAEKQERKEALEGVTHRLQILEAKPDFDPSNLEAKDRELEEQLSGLHNYDDRELRAKDSQHDEAILNLTRSLGKAITEVAIVNKLIYDMPGFEFYNTDNSVKALASYLHDNRLDYSISNMREMSRVNHQELVANLSSASRGQGQKLTLTYQPKRLPDNFRLLAYTDEYRYDAVHSANYGGIGAINSPLAIFYIGTDPVFYVMHPKDKQVSLMTDYNDYSFGMVKSIKLQTKMEYNNRFSITKLMFRTDTSLQNRIVEYKAVLQLID